MVAACHKLVSARQRVGVAAKLAAYKSVSGPGKVRQRLLCTV